MHAVLAQLCVLPPAPPLYTRLQRIYRLHAAPLPYEQTLAKLSASQPTRRPPALPFLATPCALLPCKLLQVTVSIYLVAFKTIRKNRCMEL